jgi:chromate transporter
MNEAGRLRETAGAFLGLGLTSFGGPIAHLANFRRELVGRRRWLEDEDFSGMVALAQLLPGPTSSQVAFGLGFRRAGFLGAVTAAIAFMLPSAAVMMALGYGVAALGDVGASGWLHGLRLAAVATVARAVWGMAATLCPDGIRRALALLAAALLLWLPGTPVQVGIILGCGLLGVLLFRNPGAAGGSPPPARPHRVAAAALVAFVLLLVLLPMAARHSGSRALLVFDSFYRSGALVFGGGHVVLPLLRAAVVPRGWLSDAVFLSGYGAVQAMPGPLFTFAGFLGTAMAPGPGAWQLGVVALAAIFLPGFLLMGGAYPFYAALRARPWLRGAVAGANAAVVGILLAALVSPLGAENLRTAWDVGAVAVGIALLALPRFPPWALVLLLALAGAWLPR